MGVKRIDPERAKELLENPNFTYIDVRTEGEFETGHVPGAKNAPFMVRGPGGAGLRDNEHFIETMRSHFEHDSKLIIGCLKGGRSGRASQLLAAGGFTNVHDMRGGYVGETDPFGNVTFPGWAARGFPTIDSKQPGDILSPPEN